jgi:hypothetical protein
VRFIGVIAIDLARVCARIRQDARRHGGRRHTLRAGFSTGVDPPRALPLGSGATPWRAQKTNTPSALAQ